MSNITIKVETSKLTTAATDFENTGKEMDNLIKKMNNIAQGINGTIWQGQAQQQYVSKFNDFAAQSDKLRDSIEKHAESLREIATNYEDAEQEALGITQALANNIF